jgi:hypothetical protein
MKNLPHDPFPSAHCTAGSLSECPELSSFTAHPSHRLPSPYAICHVHFLTKPTHFDYRMSLPVPSGSLGRPRHTLRYPADPLRLARYLDCAPRRPQDSVTSEVDFGWKKQFKLEDSTSKKRNDSERRCTPYFLFSILILHVDGVSFCSGRLARRQVRTPTDYSYPHPSLHLRLHRHHL